MSSGVKVCRKIIAQLGLQYLQEILSELLCKDLCEEFLEAGFSRF